MEKTLRFLQSMAQHTGTGADAIAADAMALHIELSGQTGSIVQVLKSVLMLISSVDGDAVPISGFVKRLQHQSGSTDPASAGGSGCMPGPCPMSSPNEPLRKFLRSAVANCSIGMNIATSKSWQIWLMT